jgi:hypothetical protein
MRIIVDASGNVLMWSEDGTPTADEQAGQQCLALTPEQAVDLLRQTETANSGLIFANGVVSARQQPPPPPLTVDQKLAAVGLTLADLRQALGQA